MNKPNISLELELKGTDNWELLEVKMHRIDLFDNFFRYYYIYIVNESPDENLNLPKEPTKHSGQGTYKREDIAGIEIAYRASLDRWKLMIMVKGVQEDMYCHFERGKKALEYYNIIERWWLNLPDLPAAQENH